MRTSQCLFGIAFAAGVLGIGVLQTQAAEPGQVKPAVACNARQGQAAHACTAARNTRAQARAVPLQATKASLDREVCARLQGQVERDTCLNRVEATA